MSIKEITMADMQHLREVLKGDDKAAMWASLNRMKLSPKDKVGMPKSVQVMTTSNDGAGRM